MAPLLEARHLRKVFSRNGQIFGGKAETVAVDDFSLSIDTDCPIFATIAGESGSGKTTIARMLLGILDPSAGEVAFTGGNESRTSTTPVTAFPARCAGDFSRSL